MCRLKRSIYGIKQSFKSWHFRFHEATNSFGLYMVLDDHCVYVKRTTDSAMFLTLYAYGNLLAGNNWEVIKATKKWLPAAFEMKDMVKLGIFYEWKQSETIRRSSYL